MTDKTGLQCMAVQAVAELCCVPDVASGERRNLPFMLADFACGRPLKLSVVPDNTCTAKFCHQAACTVWSVRRSLASGEAQPLSPCSLLP